MTEYVLTKEAVRDCIDELVKLPAHRHFPGYLCLVREAGRGGRTTGLDFNYNEFFDAFFRVADGDKPYFVPFKEADDPNWPTLRFNENVAGTYAPSSLRDTSPLRDVANVDGSGHGATWSLVDEHWIPACTHFCNSTRVSVEALAGFLFRDYAFSAHAPDGNTLVDAFCEEFYYGRASDEFQHLYEMGAVEFGSEDFREHE
jgi:hypothetical protein